MVSLLKEKSGQTHTQGEHHVKMEAEVRVIISTRQRYFYYSNHWKLKEAWNVLPHSSQKETILPTPRFQTSGLQNCEIIHFCCLSHLVCGALLWQPWQSPTLLSALIRRAPHWPSSASSLTHIFHVLYSRFLSFFLFLFFVLKRAW